MTTIPEEGQERESELLRKINQKYPKTKIKEVAGLAGRDPEYPLVLIPFPSVGNIIFLLNSIRQEAEEEGRRVIEPTE